MYQAYITRIKNVEKHHNADALQIGQCFGNNVIVDMSTQDNELGVYFPVDGKLGIEYATINNLIRMKDEQGNNIGRSGDCGYGRSTGDLKWIAGTNKN